MKNKIQNFYDQMCENCQDKFKKIVTAVKKNTQKNLGDLEIFICHVDKNRNINEDNGVVPLAFIFCKTDSYAFFWKDALSNGDGSSKIKVVNNVIILSQDTINLIKETNTVKNQLAAQKREQTLAIANKLIKENNVLMQHQVHRQMAIMNRQNFLHMTKIKKMILSIGLLLILLLAALGGSLGWYFSSRHNNSNQQLPNYNWRMNLAEHLKNSQLEDLKDNREATILTTAKEKNPDLKIEDLYLQNITNNSATVLVKSSSNLYEYNSSIQVQFIAHRVTLKTDVKIVNFPNSVVTPEEESLMLIVSEANNSLQTSEVKIENIINNNEITTADLTVIEGSLRYFFKDDNNSEKDPEATVKLYFSNTNKKLLGEVLTTVNIGDITKIDEKTILSKIKNLNSQVNINEIEVDKNSITNTSALIRVSANSKDSIVDSEPIKVNYRVFNPNIGTVNKKVTDASKMWGPIYSMVYMKNNTILVGSTSGLYLLNADGTFKTKILDKDIKDNEIRVGLKLSDGTILIGTNNKKVYHLYPDGSFMGVVTNKFDVFSMVETYPGTILAGDYFGNIYQLSLTGESINDNPVTTGLEPRVRGLIRLSNNIILASCGKPSNGIIYKLQIKGKLIEKVQEFENNISGIIELQDGTILLATNSAFHFYQLNSDGTVKDKIKINLGSNFILSFVQTSTGEIFAGSYEGYVYQLNNE